MSTRYVLHVSGQGAKWPLDEHQPAGEDVYKVTGTAHCAFAYLPKSEYRICEPPEVWVDVTKDCQEDNRSEHVVVWHDSLLITEKRGYRLRKVQLYGYPLGNPRWAFIIERNIP